MAGFRILDDEEPQKQGGFRILDDPVTAADPKIGQPEELSFAERHLAPLLEKLGIGDVAGGNVRGSAVGRAAMGAADPGVALFQAAANATGSGESVNRSIANTEKQYQAARAEAGSTGFDPARLAGNIGMSAFMAAAAPGSLPNQLGTYGKAAVQGGAFGALQPVTDGGENFWTDKGKDVAIGAITGPVTALAGAGLARLVSPKASVNPSLDLLKAEGVQPTIGQSLGGMANRIEEKLTSLPIMGDRISAMRNRAIDQFNEAAINRTVAPIGERVKGIGQDAVAEAGDKLSKAYTDALSSVNHVNFNTPTFNQNLGQLQQMVRAPGGLTPALADKFDRAFTDIVLRRMSPNGSIVGDKLKTVDSDLGKLAAKWQKSATTSETELGDAILQLKALLSDEVKTAVPAVAAKLKAADTGWANLVRVEGAAARGINNEGRFTPGQLNSAIKGADRSVRDRASARGEALMQDLGNAGSMLGNRVADSGTPTRLAWGGGALAAGGISPAIPAALVAGAGAYTPPVQNALVALLRNRPQSAPKVANYLRELMASGGVLTVPMVEALAVE